MKRKKFVDPLSAPPERFHPPGPDLVINPQQRLCAKFDCTGMARQQIWDGGRTGPQVLDNCAEEHIQ